MSLLQLFVELALGLATLFFLVHCTLLAFGSKKGLATNKVPLVELLFVFMFIPLYVFLVKGLYGLMK